MFRHAVMSIPVGCNADPEFSSASASIVHTNPALDPEGTGKKMSGSQK